MEAEKAKSGEAESKLDELQKDVAAKESDNQALQEKLAALQGEAEKHAAVAKELDDANAKVKNSEALQHGAR